MIGAVLGQLSTYKYSGLDEHAANVVCLATNCQFTCNSGPVASDGFTGKSASQNSRKVSQPSTPEPW